MLLGDILFSLTTSVINVFFTAPIAALIGQVIGAIWTTLGLP